MKRLLLLASCLCAPFVLLPAGPAFLTGRVVDPSGTAVVGARILAAGRMGTVRETTSGMDGGFRLPAGVGGEKLIVTAPGFAVKTLPLDSESVAQAMSIRLELAPVNDAITVSASLIEAPLSEQGSSITVISRPEIEQRNEAFALDLLRLVPGVTLNQNGGRGGAAAMFVRGGDSKFNLVLLDGVPVNDVRLGGYFDFAHIPTDNLDRIEVSRGPQSAVYGSYANSSVINLVTRLDDAPPSLSVLAEGGSFGTRRFAVGASGSAQGYRGSVYASRFDTDGEVRNADYRNENVTVSAGKRFRHQDMSFHGTFNSSANGVPGAYGSNPVGNFFGLDLVSRNKNNSSAYQMRYDAELSPRVRQQVSGSFFLGNNYFDSPYGGSFNKDLRAVGEARTTVSVSALYSMAFGAAYSREEVKNSYISDNGFRSFPLRRDQQGYYFENRLQFRRLFLNAGLRTEVFETPLIPASGISGRPELPSHTNVRVNPKIAAGFSLMPGMRAHASFGAGIRPPGGFDLAFTNNPALKPERTWSLDAGIEQRIGNRVSLDATYFFNRYYDLIVSLGGSLARLGSYRSDNLSNSRAQGAEFSARFRPGSWMMVSGSYTYLDSEILSLDGGAGLAPQFFRVGQPLLRRPRHSGSIVSSFNHKRVSANLTACVRGETLDTEPNFGASAGLFANPGFTDVGVNVNFQVGRGVTLYGNLRNALNQTYEEVYGYPAQRLNFVAGIKWRFSRE